MLLFLFFFQSVNKKGSFLSRENETLEKLAEMTKSKSESKTGVTAKNTNNFVFAIKSPSKGEEDKSGLIETKSKVSKSKPKSSHNLGPPQKKQKVNRTLENSHNTIFGHINWCTIGLSCWQCTGINLENQNRM